MSWVNVEWWTLTWIIAAWWSLVRWTTNEAREKMKEWKEVGPIGLVDVYMLCICCVYDSISRRGCVYLSVWMCVWKAVWSEFRSNVKAKQVHEWKRRRTESIGEYLHAWEWRFVDFARKGWTAKRWNPLNTTSLQSDSRWGSDEPCLHSLGFASGNDVCLCSCIHVCECEWVYMGLGSVNCRYNALILHCLAVPALELHGSFNHISLCEATMRLPVGNIDRTLC